MQKTSVLLAVLLVLCAPSSLVTAQVVDCDYDEVRDGEQFYTGITTEQRDGEIRITRLNEGFAGSRAGLRVGDVILRVNTRRDFQNIRAFEAAQREDANQYEGCLLIRIRRGRQVRQVLVTCDLIRETDDGWRGRRRDHGSFGNYIFETDVVVSTYEAESNRLPANDTPQQALSRVSGIFSNYAAALGLISTNGLPEDLRREHARLRQTLETAALRIEGLDPNQPEAALRVIEQCENTMFEQITEWAALVRYYNDERR